MTDQQTAHDGVVHIRSTTDDSGRAACLLQWGPVTALLTTDTVLATARDLTAAAAGAEADIALVTALRQDLRAPDEIVGVLLQHTRARRTPPPAPAALRISAVAGAMTNLPLVHIARGSMRGELSPGEARDMALTWTRTATAAQIDVRLRYVLSGLDLTPTQIETVFEQLQAVQEPDADRPT